ncbi:unnamed protein product [Urochloa humidicola]
MGQEAVAANGVAGGNKPHAVVVPYPLQGHVIPAVHLALRLAERGFAVTFVNTVSVHHQTSRAMGADADGGDIFAGVRARRRDAAAASEPAELDVRYELVSDGFPLGFDRSLNHDQFMEGVLHVLPAHVEELLRRVAGDDVSRRRHLLRVAGHAGEEARGTVRVVLYGARAHLQPLLPHGPAHQAWPLQLRQR